MAKYLFLFSGLLFHSIGSSQASMECINGIFNSKQYSRIYPAVEYDRYVINNDGRRILLSISTDTSMVKNDLNEIKYGITNVHPYNDSNFTLDSLVSHGDYQVEYEISPNLELLSWGISFFVECSQFGYKSCIEMGCFWERKEKLSYNTQIVLYQFQQNSNRNYFLEFLNINVKSICVDQLDVFDEIDGDNMGYLVKDDLVGVIEEQGDWVKVKYLKTDQIYWTYMSCLD